MRSFNLPFKIFILPIIFILLFSSQSIFAQSGWQSTFYNNFFIINKIIKKDSLNYFAFSSSSKSYLKSSNGGENWISSSELVLDTIYNIRDGRFLTSKIGWLLAWYDTFSSAVLKTSDGGITWIRQDIGLTLNYCRSISIVDENFIWITDYNGLTATTNGGQSWFSKSWSALGFTTNIDKVNFVNESTGWIIGYNGILAKTTNGGQDFIRDSIFSSFFPIDIDIITENEARLMVRYRSKTLIYKTTNSGQNWNLLYTNSNLFGEMTFLDVDIAFVYQGNLIIKTSDGGSNWDSLHINSNYTVNSVLPVSKDIIIAGGGQNANPPYNIHSHANIVKTSNGGQNWIQNYYNRDYNFISICFRDVENGLTIDDGGMIFRITNAGNTWTRISDYNGKSLHGLFLGPDSAIFAYGDYSLILRTTDVGLTWSVVNLSYGLFYIRFGGEFVNSNTGFVYGDDSLHYPWIWKTTNKGLNWFRIGEPNLRPTQYFNQAQFVNENTGWALSIGHYLIVPNYEYYVSVLEKTTNGGENWNDIFTYYGQPGSIDYFNNVKFFNENTGWLISPTKIKKTTNGGENWFDYQPYNIGNILYYMVNENTGWGGDATKIYKTTNSGANWFLQYLGVYNDLRSFSYVDYNNAWFCGNGGKIYKTTNGGGIISAINPIASNIPNVFSLHQNYPNPFNPATKINFDLKNSAFAMLRIYDITGREVRTLVNEKLSAGSYSYDFNANELPSGVYFYQLQTDGFIETKKMMLLK